MSFSRKTVSRVIGLLLAAMAVVCIVYSLQAGDGRPEQEVSEEEHVSINAYLANSLSETEGGQRLDAYIEKFMKRWEIKGGSLAVMKDGQLIYSKGYGWADEENGVRMSPGNIFRVASLSKLITATAIMQLCEQGVISLDDKVFGEGALLDRDRFSRIRDRRVRNITVEQLLRHEAGFTMHKGDPMFITREIIIWRDLDSVPDMDGVIEYVLGERLGYAPGTGYCYSNVGYLILTKIIEEYSGMDYETYCQTHILHPAGCYDMHLAKNTYEEKYPNEVRYYETHDAEPVPAFDNSGDTLYRRYGGSNIEGLLGAGAWVASPSEFVRFVAAIDGDPTIPDILSQESVRTMTENKGNADHPIGWMKAGAGKDWSRTGTLAGTSALVKKESDGYIWMFVTNTSSWKGSRFTSYINRMYQRAAEGAELPERDLYSLVSCRTISCE